jgi:hypothetical protein
MITLSHHDARYLALRNCYAHKDAIKMLADYPDVRWDAESKAWLCDNRLWDDLALALGPWIAPHSPDFWCDFQEYEPPPANPRRRTKQQIMAQKKQDAEAAGRFGRAIVEQMHKEA